MARPCDYDAEIDHPWAIRWRIPRIHSPYPTWKYEVAVCVPDPADPSNLWGASEPDETEARIIAQYIDFRRAYYREHWQKLMLERPFDIDSGANTTILMRTATGWTYRRATFETPVWPHWDDPRRADFPPTPEGLEKLLDHINWGDSWSEWKAENPLPPRPDAEVL